MSFHSLATPCGLPARLFARWIAGTSFVNAGGGVGWADEKQVVQNRTEPC